MGADVRCSIFLCCVLCEYRGPPVAGRRTVLIASRVRPIPLALQPPGGSTGGVVILGGGEAYLGSRWDDFRWVSLLRLAFGLFVFLRPGALLHHGQSECPGQESLDLSLVHILLCIMTVFTGLR